MPPMLRSAAHDLARLTHISVILARHGYRHLAESFKAGRADKTDDSLKAEARDLAAPRRLRLLLQALGPTFIKLGQVLSTRPDLIPSRYQQELARLQDDVEPLPFDSIRSQIEVAWGVTLETCLAWIDETPLATASIAQVHRARLKDGAEVAIKVQRPGLGAQIRADLDILYRLARLLDATVEEAGLYRPAEVIRAFERALMDELDFNIEARNARALASAFADHPDIRVPGIHPDLSDETVLVMEFIAGRKITDACCTGSDAEQAHTDRVVSSLLDAAFHMVFQAGIFHADPHPGNLLVDDDGRICLLDFGLVGHLTANMQHALIQLAMAVGTRDADATARLIYRIGQPAERVQLHRLRDAVADLMSRYLVQSLEDVDSAGLLNELLDVALTYKIRVPPDYALMAKATVTLEGVVRVIKPDLNIQETLLPYAQRLMLERYSPQAVGQLALRSAVGALDGMQHLPLMAHQLLADLEAGRITFQISHPELDHVSKTLGDLGTKVFLGLVAMGLLLGTFFILARYPWEVDGVNVWAMVGGISGLSIVAWVLIWHFILGRLRKVSLRALLGLWSGDKRRRRGARRRPR